MSETLVEQNTILVPIPAPTCKHLFIVLTAPDGEPPKVVMVNVTTRRPHSDCTVVLTCGDHAFIKHESVVAFEYAALFEVERLERGLKNGRIAKYPDIDHRLFEVIKQGLITSPRTPGRIRHYCQQRF